MRGDVPPHPGRGLPRPGRGLTRPTETLPPVAALSWLQKDKRESRATQ